MSSQPAIMIVDDISANIDILMELLGGYEVSVAIDGTTAIELARTRPIDLILLDIVMPNLSGLEVCRTLKADPQTRSIPIIFITAKTDENSIEEAYDAGGDDYVSKPFKPREVLARVKILLERAQSLKKLEYLASHDPMTGIYNRRRFFELAEHCFTQTQPMVMIAAILDIDHFKRVNDTFGHPGGDEVIRHIGATLSRLLPPSIVFGRLGGEEFGFVGRFSSKNEALTTFERCYRGVKEVCVCFNTQTIRCTTSTGLAFKHDGTDTLDSLLMEADHALYEAKGGGRNRLIVRS